MSDDTKDKIQAAIGAFLWSVFFLVMFFILVFATPNQNSAECDYQKEVSK